MALLNCYLFPIVINSKIRVKTNIINANKIPDNINDFLNLNQIIKYCDENTFVRCLIIQLLNNQQLKEICDGLYICTKNNNEIVAAIDHCNQLLEYLNIFKHIDNMFKKIKINNIKIRVYINTIKCMFFNDFLYINYFKYFNNKYSIYINNIKRSLCK
jgi:hypothetical protein